MITTEADALPGAAPTPLSASTRTRILLYLSVLVMLIGLGGPYYGLIDIPISFYLKNRLHLSATGVAGFRLITAIPLYVSFLFGFARDRFNPFGLGDRGFFMLFGVATAALYVFAAFLPLDRTALLAAVVMLTCGFLFVLSARDGLAAAIGQQHVMSGQVSAVWNIVATVPGVLAFVLGGYLSNEMEKMTPAEALRVLFLIGALVLLAVALYGAWRPRVVFDNVHSERRSGGVLTINWGRFARHWPVYPALLIWTMWNFAPGSVTPLQFYLQNTLHAKDSDWGLWNAIFAISFVPTFFVFGLLCQRYKLRTLLFWGTVVAVPQMVPLAFIHSVRGSFYGAAFMGLAGGVASAAYIDLIIRSAPPGMQGTMMMLQGALYWIASRFGDVLGTNLYQHAGGFVVDVIAITVVYALILPALLLVPKRLVATADGEIPEGGFA
ncbi:MAG TPA: MFS transporter [Caulobacteraceae bacterium]|nr:MFS transporter [Caulobacteraceae bacterium]